MTLSELRMVWSQRRDEWRLFATETKDLPLKDQAYLGGWKSPQTLLAVYQRADEATMREGLARREGRRVQGIR